MENQQDLQGLLAEMELDHPGDPPLKDDDVVITGMSALMPGCENLKEWADKLYNKENMVTSVNPRWKYSHPELSEYFGQVPGLDRCDMQFFMVNSKIGHVVDPSSRKLLEQAHQALFDAGVCPDEVSRKRVGVFIAISNNESEKLEGKVSSGLIGGSRSMFANRISYWMNVTGPSFSVDSACAGSVVALEKAYEAIMSGQCESAIVGAGSIILHPMSMIHQNRLVTQNSDGKTKCYDINADGQSLSESVSVIYLQKYKDARRVYARLCHVLTSFSEELDKDFMEKFGHYRDPEVISRFLGRFYEEANVSPSSVEYVEGFGSADPDTDKSELQAVEKVFCKHRIDPLLMGSVTSNMGFTNVVSGLNGIIKIIYGYQTGVLAANLNCDNPRQDIAAVRDGHIKILTEHHPIRRSYAALNNFSVCGVNSHVLLQGHYKKKNISKYICALPYLVTISSRWESGVEKVLNSIKSHNLDPEELALLRELSKTRTTNYLARGFGVFATENNKTVTLCENVANYDEVKRPLWFVYSGMGSQWPGMATKLMDIPIFSAAILRCAEVLKPKGIDLVHIITSNDESTFNNILYAFIGITSIQIALTDVLHALGLSPDKIIGHSVGEIGCAYADNCLTAEEAVLLSYSRGLVSVQLPFIKGSMAAVGLGYKEVSKLCPPEIEVACHNGPDSSTLSGPADIMQTFVKKLTEQGVFAKEVNCANIAYHSRYIAKAGPVFLKMGQEIIKEPKLRSQRWLSTSVPIDGWKQYDALYSSAEYHTNNLLNSVLFEETSRHIPNGALLVEIAPHGLLQAILKRSLPPDCRVIPVTNRGSPNAIVYLLEALGKLYVEGCDVDTRALYPKVEFPVSTKTPQLSHLVEHNHSDRWNLCLYTAPNRRFAATYKPIVSLHEEEHYFLKGSVINGKRQFPFAGVLLYVWDTLAMSIGEAIRKLSVKFQDVRLYYQPFLEDRRPLELTVMLHRGSGRFEVLEATKNVIADGYIGAINSATFKELPEKDDKLKLTSTDIYKLFFERGYEYTDELRSIQRANLLLTKAEIAWTENWTTFLDGIFQLMSLRQKHDGISQASYVKKIVIDINKHYKMTLDKNGVVEVNHDHISDTTRSGGVLMKTVIFTNKPAHIQFGLALKALKFVPHAVENNDVSINLYIAIQIVAKHFGNNTIKILTINNNPKTDLLLKIRHYLCSNPVIKLKVIDFNEAEVMNKMYNIGKSDMLILNNEIFDKHIFNQLCQSLHDDTFLLMIGVDTNDLNRKLFKLVLTAGKEGSKLELFKRIQSQKSESVVFPIKRASDLLDLQNLKKDLSQQQSLTVVTTYPPIPAVEEVVIKLRAENRFRTHFAMINAKKEELDWKKLHHLDLSDNVFQNGKWGGEYYVPLKEIQPKLENVALQIRKAGDLNTLNWVEMLENNEQGIPITVHYAALNVLDAKRANAEIPSNTCLNFGMDFSGINKRKELVMGLVPHGAACNTINFKSGLLWPVPEHWSLEDAATVPLPYCMAFYCLVIKLKLVRGMNVLVHGGAGALGQAAISIAMAHDCTIFTTVSDNAKKRFLRELFPNLPANHIGNSRNDSFKDMVQMLTKGDGCEIIISNVEENLKNATLACCAMAGTTLDMAQIHERAHFQYGMSYMTKARSYCLIDFSSVFSKENIDDLQKLQWMVSDGITRGYVRPLSRVSYAPHEVTRALRLLVASRHRGRVLLCLRDQQLSAQPRITCLPQSTYLIMCDKQGLGLKLVDKLIGNGAKNIHLHLTSTLPHLLFKQQYWEKAEVKVTVSKDDDNDNLETIIKEINKNGSVDGIFMVQNDNQESVLLKLDDTSRKNCPNLRYFVIINGSRIARHICQRRFQIGLPGVYIDISLKKIGKENENCGHDWNNAVDVIETAALLKEPIVFAFVKQDIEKKNIIEVIKTVPYPLCKGSNRQMYKTNTLTNLILITGVRITSSTVDRTSLEKLGIDHGRSQELCSLLENKFDLKISKTRAPNLTIGQLKNWEIEKNIKEEENKTGVSAYFKYINPDELEANAELIPMPTLLVKANRRSDELIIEDSHMFILPGLEGHHKRFKSLCKRLKIAAAVLQLGYDNLNETVQESAQRFANVILHKLKYKGHFYLLGYEYGILIVLEIAAILESYGLTGTVFCLGGSPEDLRADIDNRLDGMTEEKLQNQLILHFFTLASNDSSAGVSNKLLKLQTFDDKIQLIIDSLRGRIPFNSQYLSNVIKSAYARIGFIRHYKYDFPLLKANLILIRTLPHVAFDFPVTASYELSVSTFCAPDALECSAIINKQLNHRALEEFSNRNLCESYLMNDENAFMKFGFQDFYSNPGV